MSNQYQIDARDERIKELNTTVARLSKKCDQLMDMLKDVHPTIASDEQREQVGNLIMYWER